MIDPKEYFAQCQANRGLLQDIYVAVPVRPHDGVCHQLSAMLKLWYGEGTASDFLEDSMGGFVEITRVRIVHDFLRHKTEKYLLMIDSDTEPPMNLPYLLARHEQPVVGSCIVSVGANSRPMLCFSRADYMGVNRFIDFEDGDRVPAMGLVEVPHVGTGAMLIRRDVLESFTFSEIECCGSCGRKSWDVPFLLPEEVRVNGAITGFVMKGEDIIFCEQVRQKGFKIHVDMEAHCGHRKTMRMAFPQNQRDPSLLPGKWVNSDKGMVLRS